MSTTVKIEGSPAQQKSVIGFMKLRKIPHAVAPIRLCGKVEGDFSLKYKGGCMETVDMEEGFRCADCCAYFHRDCIKEHFKTSDFSEPE